jgi:hypothetical protein
LNDEIKKIRQKIKEDGGPHKLLKSINRVIILKVSLIKKQ